MRLRPTQMLSKTSSKSEFIFRMLIYIIFHDKLKLSADIGFVAVSEFEEFEILLL